MYRKFTLPDVPGAVHERQPWGIAGIEPPLCEVLADPLVQAVMRRDGVSREALRRVVARAQAKLIDRISPCLAA
ncbi:MAG TPA: hypothetical protein VFC38_12920 [Stellaceae bacterium]|nr:hypothetical protein [Stellaceae bacterium]